MFKTIQSHELDPNLEHVDCREKTLNHDPFLEMCVNGIDCCSLPLQTSSEMMRPLLFAGPSGVGKGTIINHILHMYPNELSLSVSHTTRKPRQGEIDGVHYNFISEEDMKKAINDGKFIEYAFVHGNYYGTSIEAVHKVSAMGKICILDVDVQGVSLIRKSNLNPYLIFITPPSIEELERRLRGRKTEKEEDIQRRLASAQIEIDYSVRENVFDIVLVNDKIDHSVDQVRKLIMLWYPSI